MSQPEEHSPVLLHETLHALNINPDGIYIDGTFGRGGHSEHVLMALGEQGQLVALDRDPEAISAAQRLMHYPQFSIHHTAFNCLKTVCEELAISGRVNGVLLDIGVSSPQLNASNRGFSFQQDGPLDMRMDTSKGQTAAEWLATADVDDITWVIKTYGEEKFGKRIAHGICEARARAPITTTHQLVDIIIKAMPVIDKHKHPATRTFQAIRIFINDEITQLEQTLEQAVEVLAPAGRLVVISFHSLEDRIVKRFLRAGSKGMDTPAGLPIMQSEIDATKTLNTIGKAVKPSFAEISRNPRARSSVLRVAEKR